MSTITIETSVNPLIDINGTYDTSKYILGDTINGSKTELIPKLTDSEITLLSNSSSIQTGYKVFSTSEKRVFSWNGYTWAEINSSISSNLVANTSDGQTVIDISTTDPPVAGQVLTAISPTQAIWSSVAGGNLANASYTTTIGDGHSTDIVVTHNLNTTNLLYAIWENTGAYRAASCTVSIISNKKLNLHFTVAPALNSLTITIISAVFSNASSNLLPSQSGNAGLFLSTDGTNPLWTNPLPIQSTNTASMFLYSDGTVAHWGLTPSWLANPMTNSGDIIVGGTSGAAGRLGPGTIGQLLTVTGSGTLGWTNPIPTISSGTTGYILSNNGTNSLWESLTTLLSINSGTTGKLLSNTGTAISWVQNNNPPDVSGSVSGYFLTNNGTSMNWSAISQVPTVNASKNGQFLTNDGSVAYWSSQSFLVNPMTNSGDIIYGGSSGIPARLGIGSTGQVLTVTGSSSIGWITPLTNPMTTYGDLIVGGSSGALTRFGIGSSGQVLTVGASSNLTWTDPLVNPMTTVGDMIIGGTSGAVTRLGIGSSGTVLTSNGTNPYWSTILPTISSGVSGYFLTNNGTTTAWSTIPNQLPTMSSGTNGYYLTNNGSAASWATIPSGFSNPMTTAGDMIAANTGGTAGRLAIGTTGQILTVVSGGPAWQTLVLPTGLPTQTGYSSEFLTTNGSTASWTNISQVPSVSAGVSGYYLGNNGTTYSWMAFTNQIPSMTGQSGKYLSTDGSSAYWTTVTSIPSLTGNSGKYLSTDGTSVYWASSSSNTTLGTVSLNYTTSTLSSGQSEIDTVPVSSLTFQLQTIAANYPCRIRIYGTQAEATADLSRPSTQDPSGNSGLFAEFVLISTQLSWIVSPTVICFNNDTTPSNNIYMTITNTAGSAQAITITGSLLKME